MQLYDEIWDGGQCGSEPLRVCVHESRDGSEASRASWTGTTLELFPDRNWSWDGHEWLEFATRQLEQVAIIPGTRRLAVIAGDKAVPFAVALTMAVRRAELLLILPSSNQVQGVPPAVLEFVEASSARPLVLIAYERSQSGFNGPRNDGWLKMFGRSRLAGTSFFDYLPATPHTMTPYRDTRVLGALIADAASLRKNVWAVDIVRRSEGGPISAEVQDLAGDSYQGVAALWNRHVQRNLDTTVWVQNKVASKEWALAHGFPVAQLRRVVSSPEDIVASDFSPRAVLKPVSGSSSIGVQILELRDGVLTRGSANETTDIETVRSEATAALARLVPESAQQGMLIEDVVTDEAGEAPSVDYKFFFSGDEMFLAMTVQRGAEGISCYWTDSGGHVMHPNPVWTNTYYRHARQLARPSGWDSLVDLAGAVYQATELGLARVDLYLGPKGPVFGEVTNSPGNFIYGNSDKLAVKTSRAIARQTFIPHDEEQC